MKTIYILILALLFTATELNASNTTAALKDAIGKKHCSIKQIKTKQIGEHIYVEVHINTLSDKIENGWKLEGFTFQIIDGNDLTAPPIYSFTSEQRMDVIVTFSFSKDKIEQIVGYMHFFGGDHPESIPTFFFSYFFEIKDYFKKDSRSLKKGKKQKK